MMSAALSLFHSHAKAAEDKFTSIEDLFNPDKSDAIDMMRDKIIRNVAMVSPNGNVRYIAGHRSHRSHSSHRSGGSGRYGGHYSHASHMSGYSGGGGYGSSSRSTSRSTSRSSGLLSTPKPPKKTPATYSLGDRTLKSGLYGADVTELTNLLVRNMYMRTEWIKQQSGYSSYETSVTSAVKRFQKDAGITANGIANSDVISKLKSWDSSKTTMMLGVRDWSYAESAEMSGKDIDELITLLRHAGYAPDPTKLEYKGNNAVFTKDVETAVKMFQAYNNMSATGIVTEEVLSRLRSLAK